MSETDITYLINGITPFLSVLFAAVAAFYSYRTAKVSEHSLKIALHKYRTDVYDNIRSFLGYIQRNGKTPSYVKSNAQDMAERERTIEIKFLDVIDKSKLYFSYEIYTTLKKIKNYCIIWDEAKIMNDSKKQMNVTIT